MKRSSISSICAAFGLLLACLPAASQEDLLQEDLLQEDLLQEDLSREEPLAGFEGLAEVTEVLLDVLAVDGEGQAIAGLGEEDFTVTENGVEMPITGVSFYATQYGGGGELLTADGAVPSSRYFILFFDDETSGGSIGDYLARQQLKARRACLSWVEEHLLPSDWVAVASHDRRLKLHQDFTQDRAALAEGIKSATSRKNPEKGFGRGGRPLPPSGAPSLLRHLPQGKALSRQTRTLYDGLRLIADASAFVVARKNLLLFSAGFGELEPGSPIPEVDRKLYPQMEQALNDHNVAVYPIDLTPVEVRHLQGLLLNQLARDTGGRHLRNFISFLAPLHLISRENIGYYLISYQSEHPATESGYQQVEVSVANPEIKIRARRGYRFGPTNEGN